MSAHRVEFMSSFLLVAVCHHLHIPLSDLICMSITSCPFFTCFELLLSIPEDSLRKSTVFPFLCSLTHVISQYPHEKILLLMFHFVDEGTEVACLSHNFQLHSVSEVIVLFFSYPFLSTLSPGPNPQYILNKYLIFWISELVNEQMNE